MNVWFVRSNGETGHSDKNQKDYVKGEPHGYFDYREKCLSEGFARIGWPNTGSLNNIGPSRVAIHGYAFEDLKPSEKRGLKNFASIEVGDIMLIPGTKGRFWVHLGRVISAPSSKSNLAYYYHYDLAGHAWYECAHRVRVTWQKNPKGDFTEHKIEDLGGIWLYPFSRVHKARNQVTQFAKDI